MVAALVVLAGVGAIYVMDGGSGNVASAECAEANAKIAAIKPYALGEVAAFRIADTPSPVGELTFTDRDGKQRQISEWRGKTVLLNMWATWCAPCRHEMPALEALETQMGGEKFSVVPVSVDLGDDAKPKAFYAETGLKKLPFFHDGSMGIFNALKKRSLAVGMPTSILIDREGCILGSLNGPAEWASGDAKALIGAAIGSQESGGI
jgi:thiol-disulfide isomerase/thioredoxin